MLGFIYGYFKDTEQNLEKVSRLAPCGGMLRTLEPQSRVKNKNAEAHFKNTCSYKMKSVYSLCRKIQISEAHI